MSLQHMKELPLTTAHRVEEAYSQFPSALAVLAASVDGAPVGMVASTFTVGTSFDPALAVVAIREASQSWPALREATNIGVSILGEGQEDVMYQMASRKKDRFAGLEVFQTSEGGLYLSGASLWLGARIAAETPTGDHTVVLLHIEGISINERVEPLIYRNRALQHLASRSAHHRETWSAELRTKSIVRDAVPDDTAREQMTTVPLRRETVSTY
jgi:flavin reductase (DIM6/NTAB) family NADH-FMN oxidoreductase RutF